MSGLPPTYFCLRLNTFDARNYMQKSSSFTLTYQLYHNRFLGAFNFGGYNPEDIAIYGRHQVEAGYEYTAHFNQWRYSVTQRLYWHPDVHPSADPFRRSGAMPRSSSFRQANLMFFYFRRELVVLESR